MPATKLRLLTVVFFAFAVALRFAPHGENFNAVGALALFAGCYLSATEGALIALGAMALTDTIGHWCNIDVMGYYDRPTMFAVYFATVIPSLIGWSLRKRVKWANVFASAVATSAVFFVVTNFACWLDPNMGYAQTPAGLVACYAAAILFAGNHLLGSIIFSGIFFGSYAYLTRGAAVANSSEAVQ